MTVLSDRKTEVEQLAWPWLDRRAVVPMDPQVFKVEWWMGLAIPGLGPQWAWQNDERSSATLVMTNPAMSDSLIKRSPFQPGQAFDLQNVVERVEVRNTQSQGWVWVFFLRDFKEDDLEAYWSLLRPKRPEPEEKDEDGDTGPMRMRRTDFSLDV